MAGPVKASDDFYTPRRGEIGYAIGALYGRLWEWRHRRRNPRVKPEAGADRASETAAKPEETVAASTAAKRASHGVRPVR